MFSIALLLALATVSPALPAASIYIERSNGGCFSPEEGRAAFAIRAINAEREILGQRRACRQIEIKGEIKDGERVFDSSTSRAASSSRRAGKGEVSCR